MKATWKDPIGRTALIAAAAFALLSVLFVWYTAQPGLWANGRFFRQVAEGRYVADDENQIALTERTADGALFRYALYAQAGEAQVIGVLREEDDGARYVEDGIVYEADPAVPVEVRYSDGSIWRGEVQGDYLVGEDGFPAQFNASISMTGVVGDSEPISAGVKADALYRLASHGGAPDRRGNWWLVIPSLLIFAVALALWLWPEELGLLGSRWQFEGEVSLSADGIFMQRVGAVVVMVMALILMVCGLTGD
ncbi:hypothetical protein ACH6CV_01280 [Bacillota bacterium Meth-B3]